MTAADDMPNNGEATYDGNWVAAVQEADSDGDGDIELMNGPMRQCVPSSGPMKSRSP